MTMMFQESHEYCSFKDENKLVKFEKNKKQNSVIRLIQNNV